MTMVGEENPPKSNKIFFKICFSPGFQRATRKRRIALNHNIKRGNPNTSALVGIRKIKSDAKTGYFNAVGAYTTIRARTIVKSHVR